MKQIYTGRFTYFTFFKWHSIFITALVESFARVARAFKKNWITLYNIKRWNGLVTSRPSCFWCTKHILACLIPNTNFILIHARADALGKTVVDLKTLIPKVEVEDVKKKWNNLRSQFLHEHHKVFASQHSGMGTKDLYEQSVWW
jgi:hypothetical protein